LHRADTARPRRTLLPPASRSCHPPLRIEQDRRDRLAHEQALVRRVPGFVLDREVELAATPFGRGDHAVHPDRLPRAHRLVQLASMLRVDSSLAALEMLRDEQGVVEQAHRRRRDRRLAPVKPVRGPERRGEGAYLLRLDEDRKSTRLNSSHANTSYAVF